MLKLAAWLTFKWLTLATLILVLGQSIHWRSHTLSDLIKLEMSDAGNASTWKSYQEQLHRFTHQLLQDFHVGSFRSKATAAWASDPKGFLP